MIVPRGTINQNKKNPIAKIEFSKMFHVEQSNHKQYNYSLNQKKNLMRL